MKHTGITSGCATCHNGSTVALAKPAAHIPTTLPCENCHRSTVSFAGTKMNHTGITSGCVTCHNGITTVGKSAKHIPTNAACETCHTPAVPFASTVMKHTGITSGCASCHNGSTVALAKPAAHRLTTEHCERCPRSTVTI